MRFDTATSHSTNSQVQGKTETETEIEKMDSMNIPILSLSERHDHIISSLRSACLSTGFFYLQDHGIDPHLISSVYEECSKLFLHSSFEEKHKCLLNKWHRGYSPMYPFNSKDRKEGYYIGRDYQPDDSLYDTTPFHVCIDCTVYYAIYISADV